MCFTFYSPDFAVFRPSVAKRVRDHGQGHPPKSVSAARQGDGGMKNLTDREFAQNVLERQEHLIGAMNAMLDRMDVFQDALFETRKTLFELVEWLHKPASEDLDAALTKMTAAMSALADRAAPSGEEDAGV
jgi:hypothetical protein